MLVVWMPANVCEDARTQISASNEASTKWYWMLENNFKYQWNISDGAIGLNRPAGSPVDEEQKTASSTGPCDRLKQDVRLLQSQWGMLSVFPRFPQQHLPKIQPKMYRLRSA